MESSRIKRGLDEPYLRSWKARDYRNGPHLLRNAAKRIWSEAEVRYIEHRYEAAINEFGYSFFDTSPAPSLAEAFTFKSTAPAVASRLKRAA
jgi:hypothetical protein